MCCALSLGMPSAAEDPRWGGEVGSKNDTLHFGVRLVMVQCKLSPILQIKISRIQYDTLFQ